MKKLFRKLYYIISASLILYSFTPYHNPHPSFLDKRATFDQGEVQIEVKAYDKGDCTNLLSKSLWSNGYRPVQVVFINNTPQTLSVCPGSIDLDTVSAKEMLKKLKNKALGRKIGYSILGIFFWPLIIPSTLDTIIHTSWLKGLERSLHTKMIRKELIHPYSSITRVFFVKQEDLKEKFDINLVELESLKIISYPQEVDKVEKSADAMES